MYRWQKFFLKFLPNNPICMKHSLMFWSFVCFAAYFLVYNCHLRRALLKLYLGKHSRLNRQITANTWKPCLTNPIVGLLQPQKRPIYPIPKWRWKMAKPSLAFFYRSITHCARTFGQTFFLFCLPHRNLSYCCRGLCCKKFYSWKWSGWVRELFW